MIKYKEPKEIMAWASQIEDILIENINEEMERILTENPEGKMIYELSEILFCPTWRFYNRKNYNLIQSKNYNIISTFNGVKLQITKLALSRYLTQILNELDSEHESDLERIYMQSGTDYGVRFFVDHVFNNSLFHVKAISNLWAISYSHIWLRNYDDETNKSGKYPKYKPRNHDTNQFLYYLTLLNLLGTYQDEVHCIYIPLETYYNRSDDEYQSRIYIFKYIFDLEIQARCKNVIQDKLAKYHNANLIYDSKEIPAWEDLDRIPSRLCNRAKNRGGCQLKKYSKGKYNYLCDLEIPEHEFYIEENIDRSFPMFFPYLKDNEIDKILDEINELWTKYIQKRIPSFIIPNEVLPIFKDKLRNIFQYFFQNRNANVSPYYLVNRIIEDLIKTVNEIFSDDISLQIISILETENFRSGLSIYIDERILPISFIVDQEEYLRFLILRSLYDEILSSHYYTYYSHTFLGECPRRTNLIRNGKIYNDVKEFYLDTMDNFRTIPELITNEIRVKYINSALIDFYKEIVSNGVYQRLNYKGFTFRYFLSTHEKVGFDNYPILFCFSSSLYNVERYLHKEGKKNKYYEGTGKRNGKSEKEVLIPRRKDIIQAIILAKALKEKKESILPVLMIYLPRTLYGDIRIFKISINDFDDKSVESYLDIIDTNIEKNIPYTYEQFKDNELRCFYCPYSYLKKQNINEPICPEGYKYKNRFVNEY